MKIVFMGSSDFSLRALEKIFELTQQDENFQLVAVYSQPPKPFGRGYKLKKTVTHEFAEKNSVPVYTPKGLRKPEQEEIFRSLNADVAIVASYGLIIPQNILDIPPKGFINIHGSLLPRWRGAAPIQSAIWAGDKSTGITIMKMDAGVDTGDIISMKSLEISEKVNFGELLKEMSELGAEMIVETIKNIDESLASAKKQPTEGVTLSKKISKEDCEVKFTNTAENILRQIKALSPSPAAWLEINGLRLKILDAEIAEARSDYEKSFGFIQNDRNFVVSCAEGFLKFTKIQPAGKNPMSGADFLRGHAALIGSNIN